MPSELPKATPSVAFQEILWDFGVVCLNAPYISKSNKHFSRLCRSMGELESIRIKIVERNNDPYNHSKIGKLLSLDALKCVNLISSLYKGRVEAQKRF
jgi:hypothetical protein